MASITKGKAFLGSVHSLFCAMKTISKLHGNISAICPIFNEEEKATGRYFIGKELVKDKTIGQVLYLKDKCPIL